MRKSIFHSLLVSFVMLFAVSCSSDEAIEVDDYNKQTLFVYMPWSGSTTSSGLYSYLLANLDSIESAITSNKGLGNTRLMVFLSTSANQSSLYEVTYDMGVITHTTINEYTGNSYTTVEGLTSILNEVTAYAPALNYAMIIGGHGCGWTYKDDWENYPTRAATFANKYKTDEGVQMTRFFGSVSDDSYAMDIPSLADAITSAGLKMQYIMFDDCYMANVETAYELREATNFLIASTSEVMAIGMPYVELWSYLASTSPSYTNIVSEFYDFYSEYSYPYGSLSAIDCREMDDLAALMKEINTEYTFDEAYRDSVQILDGFSPCLFYDFGSYVENLNISNSMRVRFETQLSATVRAAECTDYVYTSLRSYNNTIKVDDFSGLTISDLSTHSVATKGKEKTGWWEATH